MGHLADVIVAELGDVDTHRRYAGAHLRDFLGGELVGLVAGLDLARIGNDGRADMARHHHRAFDVRCVQPQVGLQRFAEALHRELGGAVGGVRHVGTDGSPEAVDARCVDDMAAIGLEHHRQEGPCAVVDTEPADVEGPLPFAALVQEHAAAAADAGIVEQQVDLVGVLVARDLGRKALDVVLVGDIAEMGGDAEALRQGIDLAQALGFCHRRGRDVADRDVAAFGHQLAGELAAHARAAARDHGNPAGQILHVVSSLIEVRKVPRRARDDKAFVAH